MNLILSNKQAVADRQRAFVRRSLRHLPTPVRKKIRALPVKVVFRKHPDAEDNTSIFDPPSRSIYIDRGVWQDYDQLASWMKKDSKAAFVHESAHAFDLSGALSDLARDDLLEPLTGFPTNHHLDAWGIQTPAHVTATERKAQWVYGDWEWRAAELFADCFVVAFTNLPPKVRSKSGLQITDKAVEAVRLAVEAAS